MNTNITGAAIKHLRQTKGLTQAELAAKMEVSIITVSRWVRGEIEPPISTVKEITRILSCSMQEILGLESQELGSCRIIGVREKDGKKIITIEVTSS